MVDFLLVITLPFIIMVLGTRLVYNVIGALVITLMIMVFAVKIHLMSGIAITLGVISLLAGLRISSQMKKPTG